MMTGLEDRYMDAREAAAYLAVSVKTIRRYAAVGRLEAVRLPHDHRLGKLLFRPADVQAFARKLPKASA